MAIFESIPYDVVKKIRRIEIRNYHDFLLASTKTTPNRRSDSGFMNVFRYISGHNKENKKVSMTTPVISYASDHELVTGFYVPSKYKLDTVPKPLNKTVFIENKTSSLYGVIRFRGAWREKNFITYETILKAYLKEHHYNIVSPRLLFRYQPPFIPSIFRRNEIAYQIAK